MFIGACVRWHPHETSWIPTIHRSEARQVGVADATAAMIHAIQFGGAMESPGRKGSVEDGGEPFKNMGFF